MKRFLSISVALAMACCSVPPETAGVKSSAPATSTIVEREDPAIREFQEGLKHLDLDPSSIAIRPWGPESKMIAAYPRVRDFFDAPLSLVVESRQLAGRMTDEGILRRDRMMREFVMTALTWAPAPPSVVGSEGSAPELQTMLSALIAQSSDPRQDVAPQVAAMPADLRWAVAMLLKGMTAAAELRRKAVERLTGEEIDFLSKALPQLVADSVTTREDLDGRRRRTAALMEKVDIGALSAATLLLADAIDTVRSPRHLFQTPYNETQKEGVLLSCKTVLGAIRVGGIGVDRYEEPAALIIDLGGNDVYACAGMPPGGIALTLDLGGDDKYETSREISWGSAILGCQMLVDAAGNDAYSGKGFTQGCGVGGVGVLMDAAGNDTYSADSASQGFSLWGLGLLIDAGGDDRYTAADMSQGYGTVRGIGALVDIAGNDEYKAGNFSHGVGAGRRQLSKDADGKVTGGATSMCGGFGIVIDGRGDDRHVVGDAEKGAQQSLASSYFFGIGIVEDLEGNDYYGAMKTLFCAGGAAHLGLSLLADGAGNDRYRSGDTCSAYDNSIAMMVEYGGDDHYDNIGRHVAADANHSRALFVDLGGNDRYDLRTAAERDADVAVLIFIDGGGDDVYPSSKKEWGDGKEILQPSPLIEGKRTGGFLWRDKGRISKEY